MKKRAKVCFYIFVVCAFFALGILGYFVFNPKSENVMVGSKKFVTFADTTDSSSYSVSVNNVKRPTEDFAAKYYYNKKINEKNEFVFELEVRINDLKVAQERYIQEITKVDNDVIDCFIKDYEVTFFNVDGNVVKVLNFEDQFLKDINKSTKCFTISEYFDELFVEDGKYHIECVPINESGEEELDKKIELDYDYFAYYKDDFARRSDFFINGVWCDYIIEDKQELELLVWHSILYRNNNITFFVQAENIYPQNINSLTFNAINDYPEYTGLVENSVYATMNNNVGSIINFDFYLDFDFTKNYKDLKNQDEEIYNKALKSLHVKDKNYNVPYVKSSQTDLNRELEIDSVEDEVVVYNTEQLFMVVQYGAKPIFANDCIAKQVYNNAISELKNVNNSNMLTDYEKSLNIYRYLCENVVYDYVIYSYMDEKQDFSVDNFGNYSCFYLEGVFFDLDNQFAVCDGLAKAYALMCNIEGIECVKINGEVVGQGNHAWNKIKVTNPDSLQKEWAYVDVTWGVNSYSELNEQLSEGFDFVYDNYETLTHTYFLVGAAEEKIILFEPNKEPVGNFNYYKNIKYNFVDSGLKNHAGDFYINSDEELIDVFEYAKHSLTEQKLLNPLKDASAIVEIKIDKNYLDDKLGKVYEFVEIYNQFSTPIKTKKLQQWFDSVGIANGISAECFVLEDVLMFRFYI
ncbi:MAG: hypothetical protein IJD48_00795 [Clostridia bacterium]|nr:hypothetical protein [Clostridia bacterium]